MKLALKIMFIVFLVWMGVGAYLVNTEHEKAQIVMGLGIYISHFYLCLSLSITDIEMVNTSNIF